MRHKYHPVIEALKSYQKKKALSDGELAAVLSLDRSTLSYLTHYKRELGLKALRAIAQKLPELRPVVIDFVVFGDGRGKSHPES